ncbi:ATP-binding cassette domain-containing protein [Clostridium sp. DFI.5.61]|uniref:ribosomal protection-like ABC-F family protein n=2 Tax=Clostridiaceae TaxID=31979 RepID=UPI00210B8F4C|nr:MULTISPECIES: ABC-F family ATP-binding cassette domain-containing protein [Clostridium]MBS5506949.1 ABC-F family ATP-binding cassette domain-containing protein [Oscillospiraceae bacterium]MCB5924030.1 ATP-binding cassette domain-containing protein [bacterium 210820-DFI.5.26]MCQ5159217.1 ATP-binding cassette domain-containing protein [Clostridium sp. DFI.5.61]
MIDIAISGLVKEFEVGKKILDGLTFQVDSGERVGLLGKNGCGKTTLLRILTGQLDWDEGEVVLAPDKRVGLISQIPVYPAGYTVEDVLDTAFRPLREMEEEMEQLAARMERGEDPALLRRYDQLTAAFEAGGGYDTDTRKNKVCSGLQIGPGMREQLFDRLSGGEKTRVNLGRLILEDTDILLLDEPTNHLDLKATEWLEEYLDKFKGTVLAVSHDRWFLDRVVDRVIEIQEGKAEFYSGNYSFYVVEKERRYQEKLKQYEKEQAKIQQLEKAAEQLRIWAYSGNDKIFKRAQSMEKRIERMRTTDRPTRERKMEVRFGEREFRGDEVLTIKGLSKSFGQRALFSGVDLEVVGGERIALLGDNGTGKSTLIKILMGEEGPDEGKIRMGPTVKIGYLPQIIHFDHPERSLLDTMLYELDCTAQTARNRLASFKFRGEDVFKPVSALSGGEQSRLRLCMLMDEKINLLILDEPTNHLDIQSREWIEEAVEEYEGNLLFVSHDRYFIDRFATRVWVLEDGQVTDFRGSYGEYRAARERKQAQAVPAPAAAPAEKKEKPRRPGGTKNLEKEVAAAERAVAKAEEQMYELGLQIEEAASDYLKLQELYEQREALEEEILKLYGTWERLSAELEEARG